MSTISIEFRSCVAGTARATKGDKMNAGEKRVGEPAELLGGALAVVKDALNRLRFGAIQLTVHDGKVMQIDVTERTRLHD